MKRQTRPRKPRPIKPDHWTDVRAGEHYAEIRPEMKYQGRTVSFLAPNEARRLAKWLLAFADWSEYREGNHVKGK
jgi:hypothetical protein